MEQFFLDVMEWGKKTALDHIIGTRQGGVGGQKFFLQVVLITFQ